MKRPDDAREGILELHSLTEQDWAKIRGIAIELYDGGQWGKDQMRCAIQAFICWLMERQKGQSDEVKQIH